MPFPAAAAPPSSQTSSRTGATSPLDGPPPAPGLDPSTQPGGPNGSPTPQGMEGMAAPMSVPSGQLPPEILTGMMQRLEQIGADLDSFAQVTPDLAASWSLIKELLMQTAGQLLTAGAAPAGPTSTGGGFPGGGFGGPGQ